MGLRSGSCRIFRDGRSNLPNARQHEAVSEFPKDVQDMDEIEKDVKILRELYAGG